MKQSLEILKSYFETGDKPTQTQYEDVFDSLVHRDEVEVISGKTVFVSAASGNDVTAEMGNKRKPYITIDAAIAAFEAENPREGDLTSLDHEFLIIELISEGTYEINELLPQRNIHFKSDEVCTIDFSNNTNEYLNVLEANVYHTYKFSLSKGKLFNNTENKIYGDYLFFEGEFDTIETYGAAYSTFGKGFIVANEANVRYNLLKGSGIAFSTLGTTATNYFNGNLESVGAKFVVNNEGKGINYFDFDEAKGTHEVNLLKGSLVNLAYVNCGKHNPDVLSGIVSIAHTGKVYVNFKENAEIHGRFGAGETYLTGCDVTLHAPLSRLQYKLFFENLTIKSPTYLFTLIGTAAQASFKNCYIETHSTIAYIETNTAFILDILKFTGYNTIYQTDTPGSDLIVKYTTAAPTNVSYNVELQNSLITNGVLNTTLTGSNTATATLTIGSTNTY